MIIRTILRAMTVFVPLSFVTALVLLAAVQFHASSQANQEGTGSPIPFALVLCVLSYAIIFAMGTHRPSLTPPRQGWGGVLTWGTTQAASTVARIVYGCCLVMLVTPEVTQPVLRLSLSGQLQALVITGCLIAALIFLTTMRHMRRAVITGDSLTQQDAGRRAFLWFGVLAPLGLPWLSVRAESSTLYQRSGIEQMTPQEMLLWALIVVVTLIASWLLYLGCTGKSIKWWPLRIVPGAKTSSDPVPTEVSAVLLDVGEVMS